MNSMMNYKRKELATMKIIKDILMVLVVLYHSMLCSAGGDWGPEEAYNTSRALYYISSYLNRIHIYAFTFVSGYIFLIFILKRIGITTSVLLFGRR
jgi:hypothetical protein